MNGESFPVPNKTKLNIAAGIRTEGKQEVQIIQHCNEIHCWESSPGHIGDLILEVPIHFAQPWIWNCLIENEQCNISH